MRPLAQGEDLDGGALGSDREPDDVDRPDRRALDGLPLGEPLDRMQAIAIAGGILEPLGGGCGAHLLGELLPDRPVVAGEELDDAVDHLAVVLLRDVADARRQTPLDVEVEARDPAAPPRLRAFARPVAEGAVQDVERLAHLLRVRVGAEIEDAAAVPLAGEHHPRVVVLEGHGYIGERLVVAQPDVERRTVTFDEVLLEMERLDLAAGDDRLDPRRPLDERVDAEPVVAAPGLEVLAHAGAQRFGLADVEDLVGLVAEEVDAGARRQPLQLGHDLFGRHRSSVPSRKPAAGS